jgi:chitinase
MHVRIAIVLLVFCWGVPTLAQTSSSTKVVGYLPCYRFPVVEDLAIDKLTHLCIAFANPDAYGRLHTEGIDIKPVVERARRDSVKVLVSLAGGGLREEWKAAWKQYLQAWNRPLLIRNIMQYVREHKLDGVDVDLEWGDVDENYSPFILALGRALHAEGKILSLAVPAKHRYKHMSKKALASVDFINIMAYDLTGHWAPDQPGPHAPYPLAESALAYWKSQGLPPKKLVLGLPFYGWDFGSKRVRSRNFAEIVAENPAFAHRDQMGEIYYNGLTTVTAKTELAMREAGGVMMWEIGRDAFGTPYSLLEAVAQTVYGTAAPPDEVLANAPTVPPTSKKKHRKPPQPELPAAVVEGDFGEKPLRAERDSRSLDIQVYPNPFKDSVTISNEEEQLLELILTNQSGRVLHQADLQPGGAISWDTASFPHGYYTLSAMVEGKQQSKQLVKMIAVEEQAKGHSVLRNWTVD